MDVFYKDEVFPDETNPDMKMIGIFSKVCGGYVGTEEFAEYLDNMGICPQRRSLSHCTCSIGYNAFEKKWYGWSHRAMCGFEIGSKVAKGDCAYVPTDWDDLIEYAVRFWTEEWHEELMGVRAKDGEGRDCVRVEWRYSQSVPNEKLRGKMGGSDMSPPDNWGRGEWVAKTEADAKQMACDFAEGVS